MKKFLRLVLVLVLVFSTVVMPVLADDDSATEATSASEYFLKGIYDGAVIVAQEEGSRQITVVDNANNGTLLNSATNVSKVEFYKDGALVATDDVTPFTYNLMFDSCGAYKFRAKIYDKGGNVTDIVSSYKVVNGIKNNQASFEEDFEGTYADTVALASTIIDNYGTVINANKTSITKVNLDGSDVLQIDPMGSYSDIIQFRGDNATAGHRVCYYEFDMQTYYSYYSSFMVKGDGYTSSNENTLFTTQSYIDGTKRMFTRNTWRKIGVVLDYNYPDGGAPTATVYVDGQEYRRVSMPNVAGGTDPVFVLSTNRLGENIYIDNFKYTVYDYISEDVPSEYFVKGIYDGAVVVAQKEESRQITVVDNENNGTLLNLAEKISKVEFYKDEALVATDDIAPFTYNLMFDRYGAHKFRVKIYDEDGTITEIVSNYKVVNGIKNNQASFEENFEGTFADNAAAASSIIASYNPNKTVITKETLDGRNVLKLVIANASGFDTVQFRGGNATEGHRVCYYEFDMQSNFYYPSSFKVKDNGSDTLFTTQSYTHGTSNDDRIFKSGTWRKIGIVLDYNYAEGGAPTATVYVDGKEYKRVSMTNLVGSTNPVFVLYTNWKGEDIYIDNFKYTVYDVYENFGFDESPLIYKNNDFEDHEVGDLPNAFVYHWLTGNGFYAEEEMRIDAYNNVKIVNIEKDGNTGNQAVEMNADIDQEDDKWKYNSTIRSLFNYYPIKEKGVISFSFRVNDITRKKLVKLGRNAISGRHISYVDNADPENGDPRYISSNWGTFITIRDGKAYYTGNGSVKLGTVKKDTWHNIDFVVDIPAGTGTVYFDGNAVSVNLPANTVNIYEVRFDLPVNSGDVWYIDDLRIYEADRIIADDALDAQWKRYTDSLFYSGYEFESSRATHYDYMAFLKCDGKRFSVINTNRFFDGSHMMTLPAKIHYQSGVLMAPIYGLAEALGATVTVDDTTGEVTMVIGEKTARFAPDSSTYYINDKPAMLRYPSKRADEAVTESVCIQIDVLLGLLGASYTIQDDIMWIDRPNEFNWHMPLNLSGNELNGTSETSLQKNIYNRILRMALYDRPTDAEVDEAMSKMLNVHPRIEFTAESVKKIKSRIVSGADGFDYDLWWIINAMMKKADNMLDPEHEDYANDVAYRLSSNSLTYAGVGDYLHDWAFAYLMSDTDADRAKYKNAILHHLNYLSDTTQFPDFHIHIHNALNTGSMMYGVASAIDWVDWTEEELVMIEDMCRRNVLDHALHAYTCSLKSYQHTICYGEGNQLLITNGGMLLLALSLYERDPEYYQDIIRGALRAIEGGTVAYFPNGEYIEGVSYWRYASNYLARVLKGLQTSMGTDWGTTDIPGVLETAKFPFMMRGSSRAYAFGDGQAEQPFVALMMFAADQTDNKTLAQYRKKNGARSSLSTIDIANWVFDTSQFNQGLDSLYENDIYNSSNSTVVLKTGWESTDTTLAFHGGANNDGHGHMDIGSFQFDMSGVRFGIDLERENYELRDKGHPDVNKITENYPKNLYPKGYPYTGNHYYRQKGEGHNTVVANRSVTNAIKLYDENGVFTYPGMTGTYDMNGSAQSRFIDMEFGEDESFAVLNMTETNDIFSCAIRGIKLDKVNNIIYVQDDFAAKSATDFLWSMHTQQDIKIADDGRTAILSSGDKKIKFTIINDNGCKFKFEDLPAEFDTTYGSDVKPRVETANNNVRKLAVRTPVGENITRFKFAVAIQPYDSVVDPKYKPIETWERNKQ